jgi:Outer membrane protein beta-barrel domain
MKKWIAVFVLLMLAVPAMAQVLGLPIAGGAEAPEAMDAEVLAGVVLSSDLNMYGGRIEFAPLDGLSLFGDIGYLDWDEELIDGGLGFQGGAQYTLPTELPVDLALRGSLGWSKSDIKGGGDATLFNLNAGLLISKAIEMVTPYGLIGYNYVDTKVEADGGASVSEDWNFFEIAGGLSVALMEQFAIYGEVTYMDDFDENDETYVGLGGRFTF